MEVIPIIHVVMAILASWRLTELITQDVIFERLRDWWQRRFAQNSLKLFLTCTRCVSVWAGAWATIMFYFFPFANWPLALSMAFLITTMIMGHIQALVNRGIPNRQREIVIKPDIQRVEWGGFNTRVGLEILRQIVAGLETTLNDSTEKTMSTPRNGR